MSPQKSGRSAVHLYFRLLRKAPAATTRGPKASKRVKMDFFPANNDIAKWTFRKWKKREESAAKLIFDVHSLET